MNKDGKDLTGKSFHPHGPSSQFHSPRSDDRGYVPLSKVIMKIQTPTTSANGITHFITAEEKSKTHNYFEGTSV